MARKNTTKPAAKAVKNTQPKRAIDDNFVAPKKAKKKADMTFAEALAESGEMIEELVAQPEPAAADKPTRPAGTSNLANTIRSHRGNYQIALHPNGKKTQNNGDVIAQVLLFVPLAELKQLSGAWFEGKTYDHLNPGHARMCIGNLLRGLNNKGDERLAAWLNEKAKAIAEQNA